MYQDTSLELAEKTRHGREDVSGHEFTRAVSGLESVGLSAPVLVLPMPILKLL